ncbi:MAG: helix-turn-helix transcriptional regulator [bacterium]|nr:helix-turn-helix transcriptional regulator [bacterium]
MPANLPQDTWHRVGITVRTLREMRGMKPDQLATAVLISRPYLANIEAGRKHLSPVLLARVADALHVSQMAILAPSELEKVA